MEYDVCILGGGIGGYVAALKAAQKGIRAALIEEKELGGTCLNRGCIPTKSLIYNAKALETIHKVSDWGIKAEGITVDINLLYKRKDEVVEQIRNGVLALLNARRIEIVRGKGIIKDLKHVEVTDEQGKKSIVRYNKLIIATGAQTSRPSFPGSDNAGVVDNEKIFTLNRLPKKLAIIGGGVIGLEFAYIMSVFGVSVTLLEMLPSLLPFADEEIVAILVKSLESKGVKIINAAKVERIDGETPDMKLTYSLQDGEKYETKFDLILMATGRIPNLECMQSFPLEKNTSRGILINSKMETSVPNIYAIGDVTGEYQLAHYAMAQGLVAGENSAGGDVNITNSMVPSCLYGNPEMAWVGLTEEEAKKEYGDVEICRFPYIANGRAVVQGEDEGMVKMVFLPGTGEIVGAHMIGPESSNLISEIVLAMNLEATVQEIALTIHPHPTLSEAIMEAGHLALGEPIHY